MKTCILILLVSTAFFVPHARAVEATAEVTNERLGIGLALQGNNRLAQFDYRRLHIRWYFDWHNGGLEGPLDGIEYMPLVAGWGANNAPSVATIQSWIAARPETYPDGTLWTVGNEIGFDDGRTPLQYAKDYRDSYYNLKTVNPTFRVCNGAVFPIDALHYDEWGSSRVIDGRRYMTLVREAYENLYGEEMPIDAWMIHGYSFADWHSTERFEQLITAWRRWMASIGHRDKPLLMKEFSPLPGGSLETIGGYLIESHRILHTLFDPATGPADNHHLLMQRFSWFVNNDGEDQFEGQWDDVSLFDSDSKAIRPLGEVFERMALWHVGSETAQLTNGEIESGSAGQAAGWKPWRATGDANAATVWSVTAARGGAHGLRVEGANPAAPFDGGASQFIPGLAPDTFYTFRGWAREGLPLGDPRGIGVGVDPTGQQSRGDADTVSYTPLEPAGSGWQVFEAGPVRPYRGALTVWLRAFTTWAEPFAADFDDLELVPTGETLPNPYALADAPAAALAALGMPTASVAYDALELDPENAVQMVHPTGFYVRGGLPVPAHAWNPATQQVADATAFAAWLAAHPGKAWIVGDRPDSSTGDALSPEDYGRMLAAYEALLLAQDPGAQLVSAALDRGGATWWWEAARATYETETGQHPLPFDVWGVRIAMAPDLYAGERAVSEALPEQLAVLAELGDRVAFGIPMWVTALGLTDGTAEVKAAFMAAVCPRLERTVVEKWFWAAGASLLDGAPTALGAQYADLARGYVNEVPVPAPEPTATPRPKPPDFFLDDFADRVADGWAFPAGSWSAATQRLVVTRSGNCGDTALLPYEYGDLVAEFDFRIDSVQDFSNWAGILLRDRYGVAAFGSGYLVYIRQNGELGIHTAVDKQVVAVPGAVADTSVFHQLKVRIVGFQIDVWIDGTHQATWTDAGAKWPAGTIKLVACRAGATFDNVRVKVYPNALLMIR